jgi:hypothetical protein
MPGGVTITTNNVEKVFRQIALGTARALNSSMVTARLKAAKDVSANIGVKLSLVRKRLVIDKAKVSDLSVTLTFTKKRFRVIDLPAGQRGNVPHAFLATMPAQRMGQKTRHTGIFVRKTPLLRKGRGLPRSSPQLPIRELFAVSVPYVAIKNLYLESTMKAATEAFEKNAAHDVQFATGGV